MKELLAAIVLLCLSTSVLAHDIYSNIRDRDGHLCCGGHDCKPVQVTVLPDGNYYLPTTDEIIPADMATPSPDDRFHHLSILHGQMPLIPPLGHGTTNPKLDASLLQCTLRSSGVWVIAAAWS
jgi:hypothetical protein